VQTRKVVLLAFDGLNLLDLSGPLEAFGMAAHAAGAAGPSPYEVLVASPGGQMITTSTGVAIATLRCPNARDIDTLIIPGAGPPDDPIVPQDVCQWIREAAPAIRRVCSVCTGAFLLAASGVLNGRRASTHWRSATVLQARFPDIKVDAQAIYVHDGGIWTSAGVTAGIDLALALIDEDLGHAAAMEVARHLVVFIRRSENQSQFSEPLALQIASDRSFAKLHAWIREHLHEDLSVEKLAARARMSVRSFARNYRSKTGSTPARMVERLRIEAACRALERGDASLKQIARECGFGEEKALRRAFQRLRGETPLAYRTRALQSATTIRNDTSASSVQKNRAGSS
jgi:transcriptional regulator GlxA family with amidase domain